MIVDTSALVAVITREPERDAFLALMLGDAPVRISAGTLLQLGLVDQLGDPVLSRRVDDLIGLLGLEVAPLTKTQAATGRAAYRDFGRGSGHPARLNLGDCFAYALAREPGEPLLFKGDDFVHTDLTPAARWSSLGSRESPTSSLRAMTRMPSTGHGRNWTSGKKTSERRFHANRTLVRSHGPRKASGSCSLALSSAWRMELS